MIATMKRWLLHTVMIGLLAAACPVHAFYNPSTGRWLSRDPISELAFFKSFTKAEFAFKDEALYYMASAFTFDQNDPIDFVDYIGLLSGNQATATIGDCNIAIYAGHGFLNDAFDGNNKLNYPNAIDGLKYPHILKGSPKCSGGAIIACNAAKFAKIENPIPGVALDDNEESVATGIKRIDGAVGSAKTFAKSICDQCVCKQVTIVVKCSLPFDKPGLVTSGSPWCGQTITLSCGTPAKK